jgi:hypothetical protein
MYLHVGNLFRHTAFGTNRIAKRGLQSKSKHANFRPAAFAMRVPSKSRYSWHAKGPIQKHIELIAKHEQDLLSRSTWDEGVRFGLQSSGQSSFGCISRDCARDLDWSE